MDERRLLLTPEERLSKFPGPTNTAPMLVTLSLWTFCKSTTTSFSSMTPHILLKYCVTVCFYQSTRGNYAPSALVRQVDRDIDLTLFSRSRMWVTRRHSLSSQNAVVGVLCVC